MPTAKEVLDNFDDTVNNIDPSLHQKIQVMAAKAQMQLHDIHSRTIACHCECIGMDAENHIANDNGQKLPYNKQEYNFVLQKWGITDEANKPII